MQGQHVVVKTDLGLLRGHIKYSNFSSVSYFSFQGIPYAKPPVGNLRFKAPEPHEVWAGVRDALQVGNDCKQIKHMREKGDKSDGVCLGDEDCLYLNVSTKQLSGAQQPVMVFIYGGGFEGGTGSTDQVGPDFFLAEDIVLVTFNYRCGPFGFLSLDMEEVPGNAGLKDQVLALRWVQNNISQFGGDPSNVTLFGHSAGACSAHCHMLSPLSKGLFHKVILESGSMGVSWVLQRQPRLRALQLAQALGCSSQDPREMLAFLQSVPANDILRAKIEMEEHKLYDNPVRVVFLPSVETVGDRRFLTEDPGSLLSTGRFHPMPALMGSVAGETNMVILSGVINEMFQTYNRDAAIILAIHFALQPDSEDAKNMGKAAVDFFMKGKPATWDNVEDLMQFMRDILFYLGENRTRESLLYHSSSAVYIYRFTEHRRCFCHKIKQNFPEEKSFLHLKESCHGCELSFLFANQEDLMHQNTMPLAERGAISRLVKAWTSFASNGNPNYNGAEVTWKKDSINSPCFMEIGENWIMKEGLPYGDQFSFWNQFSFKR